MCVTEPGEGCGSQEPLRSVQAVQLLLLLLLCKGRALELGSEEADGNAPGEVWEREGEGKGVARSQEGERPGCPVPFSSFEFSLIGDFKKKWCPGWFP